MMCKIKTGIVNLGKRAGDQELRPPKELWAKGRWGSYRLTPKGDRQPMASHRLTPDGGRPPTNMLTDRWMEVSSVQGGNVLERTPIAQEGFG